ncbi:MAG: hypothetical protein K6B40_05700 [Firmicutes bacterium]|nr:hypothetical protein [Bacillota bacterium]
MFPIVHYYANGYIFSRVSPLMALGGLFPDLASGMGVQRDAAHQMGDGLYRYCLSQRPQALDFARGVLSHGINPHGMDHYADESWPGCQKGWCFEEGKRWMEPLAKASHLPENLVWWKSHNFIEIGFELLIDEEQPEIKTKILNALADRSAMEQACGVIGDYCGVDPALAEKIFLRTPDIFALQQTTPFTLAEKQAVAFALRHDVKDADVPAMARLLTDIREDLRPRYHDFLGQALTLVKENLQAYTG